ncbi:hypothetical protein D3C83_187660 [compost metagenome]
MAEYRDGPRRRVGLRVDQALEQSTRAGKVDVGDADVVRHKARQNRETIAAKRSGASTVPRWPVRSNS